MPEAKSPWYSWFGASIMQVPLPERSTISAVSVVLLMFLKEMLWLGFAPNERYCTFSISVD